MALRSWFLAGLFWASSLAAQAASYVPPRGQWARRTPAQVGLNAALVDSAIAFAKASESAEPRDLEQAHWQSPFAREPRPEPLGPLKPRGALTGIIVRHGYVVAEWGEPDRVDVTFSVTKSFLSTTAGLAWDRKLIPDLHAKVKGVVKTGEFDSPHNAKITWDHLLRQTSDWEGTLWDKPDWSDRPPADTPLEQYQQRPRQEPGTSYKYNDVRVNLLAYALLQVWRRPLPEVLRELVMDPIGASNTWEWHGYRNSWVELDGRRVQSVSGGAHWGGGLWISARDQARFGLLTLRRGKWGEKQILSEAWIAQALTPTGPQPTYGFMNFFLNTGKRLWPSAPESTFCHRGAGTNAICVVPEYDLVVVLRWIRGNAVDGVLKRLIEAAGEQAQSLPAEPAFATSGAFIALSVPDVDASARWYAEKLGLRVILEPPPHEGIRAKILEGAGLLVELIQHPAALPLARAAPAITHTTLLHGIFKAGILVNDYERTLAILRQRGVEIAMGPFPARQGQRANFLIRDNAGNLLQFFGQ